MDNKYEIILILKANCKKSTKDNIKSTLQKYAVNNQITFEEVGKRQLAYAVKGHKKGFYIICNIVSDFDNMNSIRDYLKNNIDILKNLIVKHD